MPVFGVTGHRGLGTDISEYVAELIHNILGSYRSHEIEGVSCIADGADSIFAEIVLRLGGRLTVIVPAREYRDRLPTSHHAIYDRLFDQATSVRRIDRATSDPDAHMEASEHLVDMSDELIAVWDGQPARGAGGTADVVAYAQRRGKPVRIIWPAGAVRDG